MAYSYDTYVGDGATQLFSITFPFISRDHVALTVDAVSSAFTWISDSQISADVAPGGGTVVQITRTTPKDAKLVDYVNGSTLGETQLDLSGDQMLYITQEASDDVASAMVLNSLNQFDATTHRIVNVVDPVDDQDAVTKVWAETSMTSQLALAIAAQAGAETAETNAETAETNAEAAQAAAEAAETTAVANRIAAEVAQAAAELAETNAETAETNAETAETNAATSETNAGTSETNAAASAAAALVSENNADTSETNAAVSAAAALASEIAAAASAALSGSADGTTFDPTDTIAATDVQAAIEELEDDLAIRPKTNKIINGGFEVAQRGTSFARTASTTEYSLDRWLVRIGSSTTGTITQESFTVGQTDVPGEPKNFLRLVTTGSGGSGNWLRQRIEDVRTLAGGPVTISMYVKAAVAYSDSLYLSQDFGSGGSGTENESQVINFTTSWTKVEVTYNMPSIAGKTLGTNHYLQLEIPMDDPGNTIDIANVKVEYGDAATDYEREPFSEEVRRCQYYYQKSFNLTTPPADSVVNTTILVGAAMGTTLVRYNLPFRGRMRVAPTVTTYSAAAVGASGNWGVWEITWVAATSMAISNASESSVLIDLNVTAVTLDAAKVIVGEWTADAEL